MTLKAVDEQYFFQAEYGIRDRTVTGVQTCALPIFTSPQAFAGLRQAGRRVRRPELTVATVDHNVPTGDRALPIEDAVAARQLDALAENARDFGVELFDLQSPNQGIVHVIGPELGLTQPGMVIVCGDSHTSTHG